MALAFVGAALVACHDDEARAAHAPAFAPPAPAALRDARVPAPRPIERHDIVIGDSGVEHALADAGLDAGLADALDAAFVPRVDLFAHARAGRALSAWTRDGALVAAKLALASGEYVVAARYNGPLAPAGFYDADGRSMRGRLLARPVALRRITSRFGQRFDAFSGAPATHRGVDYGVPVGTEVIAVGRGVVRAIGASARAGNFIKLAHAGGYESFYLHLDTVERGLRVGDVVQQGERIGWSGNTGRSTGPHLHYELHLAGIPIDPLATLSMPEVVLGPMARREHLAFLRTLEATDDRGRHE